MSEDRELHAPDGASTVPSGETADEALALEHGMTADEYARVREILGRAPTVTELGMFSVMWSEHCSYKSSKVHLRTLPSEGDAVLEGPGENAGAVDLGGGWAGVFKVESHNHPSYIEPYQGAATGVGGILRDIFTMGARPLALLDSLRFGPLDRPKNRFLLDGVVAGIAGYGNSIGVPTVGGEIYFDPSYDHNPLVNVMCFGVAPSDRIVRARATGVGNPVIYVGAKTGRDGIYGVSLLASATFDEEAEEKRPAVQVGDPFIEKLLLESCLELIERDLVVGMQDMGGAGLTCSTCEMGSKAGTGLDVDVRRVPSRERQMTPYEFMLSESQERMLLVCERDDLDAVLEVFERWDLDGVAIGEVTDDGMLTVRDGDEVVARVPARSLADDGPVYQRPMERRQGLPTLTADDLAGPVEAVAAARKTGAGSEGAEARAEPARDPVGDGEARDPVGGAEARDPAPGTQTDPPPDTEAGACREILLTLLADPSIASKRWVFQQYDQTVRTNTVQRPGGDAAVVRIKETGGAAALSLDGNPWHTAADARRGAALAVAEACRNVACTGARPLGITNCLNFGNPEVPARMAEFADAVRGMSEACRALGVPVTGGNVSFYNETEERPILPTPVIGCLGHLADAAASVPSAFRNPGDAVVLLGAAPAPAGDGEVARDDASDGSGSGVPADAGAGDGSGSGAAARCGAAADAGLGGSALVRRFHGGRPGAPPALDLVRERALQETLVEAAAAGLLESAHDCSDGGLAVALAEACFGTADAARVDGGTRLDGEVEGLLGARVDLPASPERADVALFGEAASRVVVSVAPARLEELRALAHAHDVPLARLGSVEGAPTLSVRRGGSAYLDAPVIDLYRAWATSLGACMEGEWHVA